LNKIDATTQPSLKRKFGKATNLLRYNDTYVIYYVFLQVTDLLKLL